MPLDPLQALAAPLEDEGESLAWLLPLSLLSAAPVLNFVVLGYLTVRLREILYRDLTLEPSRDERRSEAYGREGDSEGSHLTEEEGGIAGVPGGTEGRAGASESRRGTGRGSGAASRKSGGGVGRSGGAARSWRSFWVGGAKVAFLLFLYFLPSLVIAAIGLIPVLNLVSVGVMRGDLELVFRAILGVSLTGIAFVLVSFFVALVGWFLLPMALIRYAESEEVLFALSPRGILEDIQACLSDYIVAHVALLSYLCLVGVFTLLLIFFLMILPFWNRILIWCLLFFWSLAGVYLALVAEHLFAAPYLDSLYARTFGGKVWGKEF